MCRHPDTRPARDGGLKPASTLDLVARGPVWCRAIRGHELRSFEVLAAVI